MFSVDLNQFTPYGVSLFKVPPRTRKPRPVSALQPSIVLNPNIDPSCPVTFLSLLAFQIMLSLILRIPSAEIEVRYSSKDPMFASETQIWWCQVGPMRWTKELIEEIVVLCRGSTLYGVLRTGFDLDLRHSPTITEYKIRSAEYLLHMHAPSTESSRQERATFFDLDSVGSVSNHRVPRSNLDVQCRSSIYLSIWLVSDLSHIKSASLIIQVPSIARVSSTLCYVIAVWCTEYGV